MIPILTRLIRHNVRAVNQATILLLLCQRGPHAVAALAEQTGDTRQATDVALAQMVKRGWVELKQHRLPGVPRTIRIAVATEAGEAVARAATSTNDTDTP